MISGAVSPQNLLSGQTSWSFPVWLCPPGPPCVSAALSPILKLRSVCGSYPPTYVPLSLISHHFTYLINDPALNPSPTCVSGPTCIPLSPPLPPSAAPAAVRLTLVCSPAPRKKLAPGRQAFPQPLPCGSARRAKARTAPTAGWPCSSSQASVGEGRGPRGSPGRPGL